MKIEVLLAIMNIKSEEQLKTMLEKNKITGQVLVANQINKNDGINIDTGKVRILSYNEIGVSNNRNRLLENAKGDILIFADDDTIFEKDYEQTIRQAYENNKEADMIIFYSDSLNKKREKAKKIGNKKLNKIDLMRVRTCEISLKRETLEKMKKNNIKFDTRFGPGGAFLKGEESIFIGDLLEAGIKIYSVNKKVSSYVNEKSTWFTGYNERYLYDQGAIFCRIYKKYYKILVLQYVIRKYFLYRKNITLKEAYKQMCLGAKKYEEEKT